MEINKNALLYQGLRNTYYTLWRQNPHVYRFLLPLKLLSATTHHDTVSRIRFPPQRVERICLGHGLRPKIAGDRSGNMAPGIQGGDWDRHAVPVSHTWIYRCVDKLMNTQQQAAADQETQPAGSKSDVASLNRRLEIEAGGKERLTEMVNTAVTLRRRGQRQEAIRLHIGRKGEILCAANASSVISLGVARLSSCSELEECIDVRHKSWQQIRYKFFALAASAFSQGHGALYQQLWHPDLRDIPHLHKGDDRARFIEAAAKEGQAGRALDIGANLGFFCHQLEDLGYSCRAIENNAVLVDHMRLLRDIEGKTFAATCGDVLGRGMNEICSQEYDLVLALAIFHHFMKHKNFCEALKRLLGKLQMKRMVLQTHNPEENQMRSAYKNLEPEAFADHILDISCLNRRQFMGKTPEGRHVFLLSRA